MQRYGIGDQELKLAKILWARDGVRSGEVVSICKEELNWAKSTTYTMLRRLCQRGLFKNENCCVSVVMTEEDYLGQTVADFIDDKYQGSMVDFVKAYTKRHTLSSKEKKALTEVINQK